jgi:hypothetical protein
VGYKKGVAVFMMNERYSAGDLRLERQDCIRDGEPYGSWIAIDAKFGNLKLDRKGHVRVDPRIKLWREARYRIAEGCDVQALFSSRPPAAQTSHSPDSSKPLAAQHQPTKAAKPDAKPRRKSATAERRDAAIKARLDKNERPGSDVHWSMFCHNIRLESDGFTGDPTGDKYKRGFTPQRRLEKTTPNIHWRSFGA